MKILLIRSLGIFVIIFTAFGFFWFAQIHPEIVDNLKQTTTLTLFIIVLMYFGSICSMAFILQATLRLYGRYLSRSEYFLLTAYSSLTNFFGLGQSGLGVRAVYLKAKHGLPFNQFLFGTLIYFAWLILLSGAMLVAPTIPWWLTCLCILIVATSCAILVCYAARPNRFFLMPKECKPRLVRMVLMTGVGTAIQIAFLTAAYFTELCSVNSQVKLSQAISFTGAANFSLFVSITPGAIGIREAFLFFSQNIHGVSAEAIATACALDRAVYFLVLALLGLLVLFTHAGRRFRRPGKAKSQGNP